MGAEECKACPLYRHFSEITIPAGAELAWSVHRKLTRPAVERFGLTKEAWAAMGLDLDSEEMDVLFDQLSDIEIGVGEARKDIQAADRKKQEGR